MPRKPRDKDEEWEPTQEELELMEFTDTFGASVSYVEVFRVSRGNEMEQLDRISYDEIRTDPYGYLRDRFGHGKFRLIFKGADNLYKKFKTLIVGTHVKPDAPATPSNGHGQVDGFLREQLALQQNLLLAMIGSMKGPDLGAMMQGLGSIMQGAPKQDPVQMFTALVTAFGTMKGPQKDEDWLERAQKIIGMAKDLSPEPSTDSVWGVVRDVGKEVVHRLAPPTAVQVAPPQIENVTSVQAQVQIPIQTPEEVKTDPLNRPIITELIKYGLKYLKEKARLKKDPDFYVDLIFENSDEGPWNAILMVIQRGATFENLLQFDPEIAQNAELKTWFETLFNGIQSDLNQSDDTLGEAGNTDNPAKNAGTGTEGQKPPGN